MSAIRSAFAVTFALLVAAAVRADDPLYLQPAYDEIVLDDSNAGAVLRVQPLAFPGRKMPPQADRKEDLEFELIDRPGEKFAVPWVNVADIRFFERLVLAEADALVKAGQFDEAQPYFLFLETKYPQTPGLKEAISAFLYIQVGAAYRAGRHDEALALLVELYARDPQRQGATTAYERVTAELVKNHLAAGRFAAARGLLRRLGERYPAAKATLVEMYEKQLIDQAQGQFQAANEALAAKKPRDAYEAIRRALAIWPTLAGAGDLAQTIHKDYPVIAVGVTSPLVRQPGQRIDDWASIRTSRLLATPLVEQATGADGPFKIESQTQELVRYVRRPGQSASGTPQTAEIVERTYPDSAAALVALTRGEISVIDRISPWEVSRAASSEVVIGSYALPTVHVLVPNPARPLVSHRIMRRALVYAIDRQAILRRGLLGGQALAGCDVLSGPFPRGAASDPFAYAYDAKVEPRPYEPGTALVLTQLAINETQSANKTLAPLVLVHPADPIARIACQSIARQLKQLNLQVNLKELGAGTAGEYDLRYVELVIREPTVDAWQVLGPRGVVGMCSPAMLAALRAVEAAPNKQEAAARLQAVHRLAAAELPVIPLWQLSEHFAVHKSIQGVAQRPASLYEGVEAWQAEFRAPSE
jgi:tetratricopeptide (TPR) repeat protein